MSLIDYILSASEPDLSLIPPIVDCQYRAADLIGCPRKEVAETICNFFHSGEPYELRPDFYRAVEQLLSRRDSERILLYLPLEYLYGTPASFKDAYLDAWYRLLSVQDVRENFNEGDCFEPDARPGGEVERVVKCAHLTPWLIDANILDTCEVDNILRLNRNNEVLLRSFQDTWNYYLDAFSDTRYWVTQYQDLTSHIPKRKRLAPLYISKKRQEWLAEKSGKPAALLTPDVNLEEPFTHCLEAIRPQLKEIASHLGPSEIVLVGGSSLKGYGTVDSDLDIYNLADLESHELYYPGSVHSAHLYLDCAWLSRGGIAELTDVVHRITRRYSCQPYLHDCDFRRYALELIESDLLQYRLLHKGFARLHPSKQPVHQHHISHYKEMDNSVFYDDDYRKTATMLFAKYVYLYP